MRPNARATSCAFIRSLLLTSAVVVTNLMAQSLTCSPLLSRT
jgi:hypothetical protein